MKQELNSRRDYELYIKHTLKTNYTMTNKVRSAMLKVAMQCFDDGIQFHMGKLKVEI